MYGIEYCVWFNMTIIFKAITVTARNTYILEYKTQPNSAK